MKVLSSGAHQRRSATRLRLRSFGSSSSAGTASTKSSPTRPRKAACYGAELPVIDSGLTPPPPGEASDTGGAGSTTGTATAIGAPAVKEAEKVPVLCCWISA